MINVLIAENDPMVASLIRRYLSQIDGFACVAVTSSGKEALAIIKKQSVDLVLSGIHLQEMNGLDLIAQIRSQGCSTDVVIITLVQDRPTILAALRYGVVDYLIKPFEFSRFSMMLTSYRQRAKLLGERSKLSQEELDQCVLKVDAVVKTEMPRGIDRGTLRLIWARIQMNGGYFTTDEMAKSVGISRVSMRKYLGYLHQSSVLKLDIHYGSIGRPVYRYQRIANSLPYMEN